MAYQLVYTSSPRGLKPGAFGFCVVACTRGMKEQTTSALEALSGYRRVYADPRDALRNPTSYSHVLFETATGRLRILARVADAGLDYSGRTNKIASFLDVATGELTPPGPAALFSQPGLFVTNWSSATPPQYYEAPISLPNYVSIPSGCDEWRNTTGDSAWAGVLASTVATRRPVALIVRPEQNVLRLFQESLALLPPGERWNATFSTYYMKTPPGVQCQWKAVMQGSPEELASRSTPGGLVLDLTAPNKLPSLASLATTPEAQTLVAAARGVNSSVAVPTQLPERAFQAVPNPATPPPAFDASPLPGAAPIGGTTPYDLASPVPSGAAPRRKTLNYGRDAILTVTPPPQRGNRETALLTKMLACVGAATILLGIVVAILWSSGVFEKFGDAVEEREKAVAEANGQPNVPAENTPEQKSPTESGATIPSSDEPQESKPTKGKDSPESDSEAVPTAADSDKTEDESPRDSQNLKGEQDASANADESEQSDVREVGDSETMHKSADSDKNKDEMSGTATSQTAQTRKNAATKTNKSPRTDDLKSNGEVKDGSKDNGNAVTPSSNIADEKRQPDDNEDAGESVDLDDVAKNIMRILDKFTKNGGEDEFNRAQRLVVKYDAKSDNSHFSEACERFNRIKEAMNLDSFAFIIQNGKGVQEELNSTSEIMIGDSEFYSDLEDFFQVFVNGVVFLEFSCYDDVNSNIEISAAEFKRGYSKDIAGGRFYIDRSERFVMLQFDSVENSWRWRLNGTVEVEAFANSDSIDNSSRVFYAQASPILDCSDLTADFSSTKVLDLNWFSEALFKFLFDEKTQNLSFSDSKANSLILEYVPVKGSKLSVATSQDDFKNIVEINKSDPFKRVEVLKGKELIGNVPITSLQPEYAVEIVFSLSKKGEIKKEKTRWHWKDNSGRWPTDNTHLPKGLSERVLTFNVRYRAYRGQETKKAPIIGVIRIPIEKL